MLDTLRIAVTLAVVIAFGGIVWWAYAPSRKELWELRGVLSDDELRNADD